MGFIAQLLLLDILKAQVRKRALLILFISLPTKSQNRRLHIFFLYFFSSFFIRCWTKKIPKNLDFEFDFSNFFLNFDLFFKFTDIEIDIECVLFFRINLKIDCLRIEQIMWDENVVEILAEMF